MTRTVEDGVRLFNVVAGFDPADSLTVADKREDDYRDFLKVDGLEGKRIGIFRALVDHDDADPEILKIFETAIADLSAAGATIVDTVEIEDFRKLTNEIGWCGPFRYDVAQYLKTLDDPPFIDVMEVIETGQFAPESREALDFYAQFPVDVKPDDWEKPCLSWPNNPLRNQLLANAIRAMDDADIDALVYPTWTNPPARIDRAVEEYKGDNSQLLVPSAGLPAVTVPMGFWRGKSARRAAVCRAALLRKRVD